MQEQRSQGVKADAVTTAERGSNHEENEQELLCVCQQPYNVDTAMVSCDVCEDWYHLRCVGVTQTAAKSMKKYVCPVCTALKGNAEPLEAALAKVPPHRSVFCWLNTKQHCSRLLFGSLSGMAAPVLPRSPTGSWHPLSEGQTAGVTATTHHPSELWADPAAVSADSLSPQQQT